MTPAEINPVDYIDDGEPWTQSVTNRRLYAFAPERTSIDEGDIAHGLSTAVRFGRQASEPYSVAQHLVHACDLVQRVDAQSALHALMHDAGEYVLGDLPTPYKSKPEYRWYEPLERRWMARIYTALALPGYTSEMRREVAEVDALLVSAEALRFMPANPYWTARANKIVAKLGRPLPVIGSAWSPKVAARKWLERFHSLEVRP